MTEVTTELKFDRLNDKVYFEVTNYYEKIMVINKLKEGGVYKNKITRGRRHRSLGYYWLLVTALGYFQGVSEEYYHNQFKKMYFGAIEVNNIVTGEIEQTTKSISFDKMDEIEFKEYLSFVCNKLEELGIDPYEIIDNYKKRNQG